MKIRIVERNDRSNIRQCEDCKAQGKDGVFLTLGFFGGFVCNDCGVRLILGLEEILHDHYLAPHDSAIASGVAESAQSQLRNLIKETTSRIPDSFNYRVEFEPAATNLVEQKTRKAFKEYAPDAPPCDSQPHTATFSVEPMQTLDARVTALENGLERIWSNIGSLQAQTAELRAILDSGLPQSIARAWNKMEETLGGNR